MSTPFFEISGLVKRFGGLTAIDNLSLQIEKGTLFSIIGPNGAGKSTVFNCINGLYNPEEGEIKFKGESINGLPTNEIAGKGIARTFQNLELFANMTVLDNLMLGRHQHMKTGVWSAAANFFKASKASREEVKHRERVEHIIDLLDLQSARSKYVSQLPYGSQKLVELGRALATEPEFLLLDEPAAGMNNEERDDLIFWIKDIQEELGITILMIEHHMQMVTQISDRILCINFGKPIVEGTAEEVVNHPEVVKAYLG